MAARTSPGIAAAGLLVHGCYCPNRKLLMTSSQCQKLKRWMQRTHAICPSHQETEELHLSGKSLVSWRNHIPMLCVADRQQHVPFGSIWVLPPAVCTWRLHLPLRPALLEITSLFFPRVRTPCGRCAQVIIEGKETLHDDEVSHKNTTKHQQPKNKQPNQKTTTNKNQATPDPIKTGSVSSVRCETGETRRKRTV